jgi:capsular polysaccharide biosynthesis protein
VKRLGWTWVVPLAVALALAAGALVTFLQAPTYEARATIEVTRGNSFVGPRDRAAPALEALLRSDIVAANTASTLRLDESPAELRRHLRVDTDSKNLLLTLRVRDEKQERARAIAAEIAAVFVQQVRTRFGASGLRASVLDAAHGEGKVSPRPARDLAISGAAGLLVGAAALLFLRRDDGSRRRAAAYADEVERRDRELAELRERLGSAERERDEVVERAEAVAQKVGEQEGALAEREATLAGRVEAVTRRELALARRAGPLAARERDVDEREQRLAEREQQLATLEERTAEHEREVDEHERELDEQARRLDEEGRRLEEEHDLFEQEQVAAAARAPEPQPEAAPPARRTVLADTVPYTLDDLARLAEARRDELPDRAEEWRTYLYFLREHADVDGRLPASFDSLVDEVFADLLR